MRNTSTDSIPETPINAASRRLMQLCLERASDAAGGSFPLGLRSTAKAIGGDEHDVRAAIAELVKARRIERAEPGEFAGRAARYRLVLAEVQS